MVFFCIQFVSCIYVCYAHSVVLFFIWKSMTLPTLCKFLRTYIRLAAAATTTLTIVCDACVHKSYIDIGRLSIFQSKNMFFILFFESASHTFVFLPFFLLFFFPSSLSLFSCFICAYRPYKWKRVRNNGQWPFQNAITY